MQTVPDEKEIALLQRKFEEKLKKATEMKITVGHLGGSWAAKGYYSSKLGIWFTFGKGKIDTEMLSVWTNPK